MYGSAAITNGMGTPTPGSPADGIFLLVHTLFGLALDGFIAVEAGFS
jgi:hypothetical protein